MNTTDILSALMADPYTAPLLGGVFAADHLPLKITRPSLFVANTDIASKEGSHWVAFYFPRGEPSEYFDSYGLKPLVQTHLNFVSNNATRWIYNNQDLQALGSNVCGNYCVLYLKHRARGYTMEDFISKFSKKNLVFNDRLVSKMYQQNVKQSVRSVVKTVCQQCCCERLA